MGLARVSKKRRLMQADYDRVVDAVFQRAKGQCEVVVHGVRCAEKARDPHHCLRPRLSHHAVELVIAVCRTHHDRTEAGFARGRLLIDPRGDGTFRCSLVYAASKFTARGSASSQTGSSESQP